MFSLVPTLFSNQIYLFCRDCSQERPLENAYVNVSGETRFEKLKAVAPDSTTYNGVLVLQVYDWILSKPDMDIPNPTLTYDNFKTDLTARIEGLEPQVRDFLAFSAVSSPMFYQNTGGINLTMYDSTKAGLPKLVVREIRKAIPEDMGDLHTIRTDFGSFAMRYKYAFVTGDADQPLTRQEEDLLNLAHLCCGTHSSRKKYTEKTLIYNNSPFQSHINLMNLRDIPSAFIANFLLLRRAILVLNFFCQTENFVQQPSKTHVGINQTANYPF